MPRLIRRVLHPGADVASLYRVRIGSPRPRSCAEIGDLLLQMCEPILAAARGRTRWLAELRLGQFMDDLVDAEQGGVVHALIGMASVSNFSINEIVKAEALNVFLARDAGLDYMIADLQASAPTQLVYISRASLGPAYELVARRIRAGESPEAVRSAFDSAIGRDPEMRRVVHDLVDTLEAAGALAGAPLRFVDSWAEGTLFFTMQLALESIGANASVDHAALSDRTVLGIVRSDVDYDHAAAVADGRYRCPHTFREIFEARRRAPLPTRPLVPERCPSEAQIASWYARLGLTIDLKGSSPQDFWQMMRAKVYAPHNHFASLNLGHPIDWSTSTRHLLESGAEKLIGHVLRQIVAYAATSDPPDARTQQTASTGAAVHTVPGGAGSATDSGLTPRHLLRGSSGLGSRSTVVLRVLEHVVTASADAQDRLLANLRSLAEIIGWPSISAVSGVKNYDFQYFCNRIKLMDESSFAQRASQLTHLYRPEDAAELFALHPAAFANELAEITTTLALLRGAQGAILDCDGTLTPLEQGVELIRALRVNGLSVDFVTGRPARRCGPIFAVLAETRAPSAAAATVFCAHGAIDVDESGRERGRRTFDELQLEFLRTFCASEGFVVASSRPYRRILAPEDATLRRAQNFVVSAAAILKESCPSLGLGVLAVHSGEWAIDVTAISKERACMELADRHGIERKALLYIGDDVSGIDEPPIRDGGIGVSRFGIRKTRHLVNFLCTENVNE